MSIQSEPERERRTRIRALLGEVQNLTSELGAKALEMYELLMLDEAEAGTGEVKRVGRAPEV